MPRTLLEERLIQKKKSKGVLVPLLEEMFRYPVRLDNDDAEFIKWLIERNNDREARREKTKTFSPSALGSCLRQVFLSVHHEDYDVDRIFIPRIELSGWFFDGEFEHIKWQMAIRKLAKKNGDLELVGGSEEYPGFEIPVFSKRGDHQGTIDILLLYKGSPRVVDVKGLNLQNFRKAVGGTPDPKYPLQTSDYMMLLNSMRPKIIPQKVEKAILLVKNKAGYDKDHPLALHEVEIDLKKNLPEVQRRLKELRKHEKEGTIPKPECESTKSIQFRSCSFQKFCKEEVLKRENKLASRKAKGLRIHRPKRPGSSR